jgi:hypothetical protein
VVDREVLGAKVVAAARVRSSPSHKSWLAVRVRHVCAQLFEDVYRFVRRMHAENRTDYKLQMSRIVGKDRSKLEACFAIDQLVRLQRSLLLLPAAAAPALTPAPPVAWLPRVAWADIRGGHGTINNATSRGVHSSTRLRP